MKIYAPVVKSPGEAHLAVGNNPTYSNGEAELVGDYLDP